MGKTQGTILLVVATCALMLKPNAGNLQNCFDVQVAKLLGNVSASAHRLHSLTSMQRTIEDTLNTVWPGTKVNLFGSLSTGLGSPTSDADFSVTLPGGIRPDYDIVNQATILFKASPHIYQQIHIRSRLPAIALYFAPADIIWDIHFRTEPFETIESSLLHYLLHLDDRALNLAIIVKHWAKLHKLIYHKYLTSYGMMMLVLFFLQQRSVLPSVVDLQSDVPAHILPGKYRFNVAFEKRNLVSKHNESLYEILGAFFEYYENFDFDEFIISPFLGQSLNKITFENLDSVPYEFYLYKSNVENNITKPINVTALCIQSLLMLNDNCAWRVDSNIQFKEKFRSAGKSYRQNEKCSFLKGIANK